MIKEHNKQDYETKCPNCGSEDISEVTGWCFNHSNPTFEGDRPFCSKPEECGLITDVKNAFFCNECDTIYDEKSMANWNWQDVWYVDCPVGKSSIEEEQTPEEYSETLLDLMSEYSEGYIDECLKDEHIIEVIVIVQKHIAEQIRIILIKKMVGQDTLKKQKTMVSFLKNLKDEQITSLALIYDIINDEQKSNISAINTLRNKLCHALNLDELQKYSKNQRSMIIDDARKISQILDKIIFQQN